VSIQQHLDDARRLAGPDPKRQCIALAAMVEGLLSAAQGVASAGYTRLQPNAGTPSCGAPDAILAGWEHVDGIDSAD